MAKMTEDSELNKIERQKRKQLKNAKRIVVKVGTSTLTYPETGKLNLERIDKFAFELADLVGQDKEIIFVTSAAIAAGLGQFGLSKRSEHVEKNQAFAAIGQGMLMHIYEKIFSEYGQKIAQILLTKDANTVEHQRQNARAVLLELIAMKVIPIINENDAVVVDEIQIGDNDTLSAMVAKIVDADLLILLTDIDGVYTGNPRTNPNAKILNEINEINSDVEHMAGGAGTSLGTGGMITKIRAAKEMLDARIPMVLAPGKESNIIHRILDGEEIGTLFEKR